MSEYRTDEEVRSYDLFKGVVLALLSVSLFLAYALGVGRDGSGDIALAPAESDTLELEDAIPDSAASAAMPPELLSPALDDPLAPGILTFSGLGTPGTQVAVVVAGQELGRTAVAEDGSWQMDIVLPRDISALDLQTIDSTGNVVAERPGIPLSFMQPDETGAGNEESARQRPFVVDPLPDGRRGDSVSISGSGNPGDEVAVDVNGEQVAVTSINDDGIWSVQIDTGPDAAEIGVRRLNAAGEAVETVNAGQVAAVPVIPPTLDFPATDLVAGAVTLSGSGEPGSTIQLLADGEQLLETTVDADGSWTAEADLAPGDYEIDIALLDASGNVVDTIPALSLPVQAPPPPTLALSDLPLPDFNPLTGSLALQGITQAGARVAALIDGNAAAEDIADENGQFELNLSLPPGAYAVAVAQIDSAGNRLVQSEPAVLDVPGRLPQIDLPDFGLPDDLLAQLTRPSSASPGAEPESEPEEQEGGELPEDTEDDAQSTPNQFPILDRTDLPDVLLPAGAFSWTGSADPGTEVALIVDGEIQTTATADTNGQFTLEGELPAGDLEIQIGVVGEDGEIAGQSRALPVMVAEGSLPTIDEPQTDGDSTTLSGTADPGATVQVTAGGEVVAETTSGEDGTWTVTVEGSPGPSTLRARVLGEDGSVALLSSPYVAADGSETVAEAPAESDDQAPVDEDSADEAPEGEADNVVPEDTADGEPADSAAPNSETELVETADHVIEAIDASGSFTTLKAGLEAAGLTTALSDAEEAYTLFAPTDEAFAAIPPSLLAGWDANPETFAEMMSFLVVPGAFQPEQLTDGLVLQTLAGTNVGITREGDLPFISGVPLVDVAPAGNSIVYALPRLILPPLLAGQTPPLIDESGVPFFTGPDLTVVGVGQPGDRIMLTVDGDWFGRLATVQPDGSWLVEGVVAGDVRRLLAYMIDDRGVLKAVSQEVLLPVPESE